MLRKVIIHRFKKFPVLEINLKKKVFVVGPNNSGKTTVLQALALGAEIGSAWFKTIEELDLDYRHADAVEVDFCSNFSMAWEHLNELWYNKDITHSIDVKLVADDFNVGFCLGYVNTETVSIRPSSNTRPDTLAAYAQAPLKAMYIPSLSGLNTEESEYKTAAIRAHIAQGQSGSVLRSLIAEVSLDEEKWTKLQQTVGDMFGGAEISRPSGTAPIIVRYRDSPESHWHRLINASAGFLQTVLVQSALLHSDATLFLIDEPDAHLHTLLKESMDRIISKHCDDNDCQVLIATHSSLLIDTANKEGGQNLFLISAKALRPVGRRQAKVLLKIPFNEIVLAETTQRILYVEGRSDLDILRAWASVLNHPAGRYLNNPFWIATAERPKNNNSKSHYQALKAQVPTLQALEIQDRNGKEHEGWDNLNLGQLRQGDGQTPVGMQLVYWTRREIESYLLHPKTLQRFLTPRIGKNKAQEHINYLFAPAVIKDPFGATDLHLSQDKRTLANVLKKAEVHHRESDYDKIASVMLPCEVHPDVVAMLDKIKTQLMDA